MAHSWLLPPDELLTVCRNFLEEDDDAAAASSSLAPNEGHKNENDAVGGFRLQSLSDVRYGTTTTRSEPAVVLASSSGMSSCLMGLGASWREVEGGRLPVLSSGGL